MPVAIKNVIKGVCILVAAVLFAVFGTAAGFAMNHIPGVGPAVILAFGAIILWRTKHMRNLRNRLQTFRRGRRPSSQQPMRGNMTNGRNQLRNLVIDTLADLRKTKPADLFTPDLITNIIANKTGQKFTVNEVKEILREQWGRGIEPVTVGGHVWQFGPGKPPRSQEIPVPGSAG